MRAWSLADEQGPSVDRVVWKQARKRPVRDLGCQQVRREIEVLSRLSEPEDGAAVELHRLDRASNDLYDAAGHIDGRGAQCGDFVRRLDDQGKHRSGGIERHPAMIADVGGA